MSVTRAELVAGIRALDLAGRAVCAHASLSSFAQLEGGAATVVEAFLEAGCTLMVPAHWEGRRTRPLPHQRYARNGTSDSYYRDLSQHPPPAPLDPLAIDRDMGAIAAAAVRWPSASRGAHLALSFAAVGPLARALLAGQTLEAPFAPLDQLAARGGALLLIGVGLDKLTALHLAEERAGRLPFRRWLIDEDGDQVEFPSGGGGCSGGFERLAPALRDLERVAMVGPSRWRCYPAGPAIDAAAAAIRADPAITHCGKSACERCRDAVLGGFLA